MPLPDPRPLTLASVNRMGRAEFAAALGGVFEHSQSVLRPRGRQRRSPMSRRYIGRWSRRCVRDRPSAGSR
jgi:hypothetical protein